MQGLACFNGGGSLERRRSRQSALRQGPWPLGCRAAGRVLAASFRAVVVPPTSPAHGRTVRKPTPATEATGLRRPPHQQNHRSRLWRLVAAVAAFCVPTTPAAPGTPPRLAGRSRQTAALAAAAFEAASPSLSIWGGVGVPVPQLAALCVGARTRADTPRPGDEALGPWCPVPSSDCCPELSEEANRIRAPARLQHSILNLR